jgi:hypothetical protein
VTFQCPVVKEQLKLKVKMKKRRRRKNEKVKKRRRKNEKVKKRRRKNEKGICIVVRHSLAVKAACSEHCCVGAYSTL